MKFRPVELSYRYSMQLRLKTGKTIKYNYRSRKRSYPIYWQLNQQHIFRVFSRLHYLGCHSPEPIQKKWLIVYNRFEEKHFATKGKASGRYLNKYTAYNWL